MSDTDDAEAECNSSPSLTPLPIIPANQGPPSVPLSTVIEAAIQKTFHELSILSELLSKKTNVDRKIAIIQFAHFARQLFIRLLAIVKWAKSAGKVDACTAISCFLSQQALLFIDCADKLSGLSKETLASSKIASFQIPAAVDILTLGTYPRLPACIKNRFVSDAPIKPKEEACLLRKLNQVIQQKLAFAALPLPERMRILRIKNGVVILGTPGEFQACLTLLGDLPATPWTLLKLKILVDGGSLSDGESLVHPLQVNYVHQAVQARLNSATRPMDELYTILHSFCTTLRLEALYCQAVQLIMVRNAEVFEVDDYVTGKRLVLSLWRPLPDDSPSLITRAKRARMERDEPLTPSLDEGVSRPFQIIIHVCAENPSLPLQITHQPPLESSNEADCSDCKLPNLQDYDDRVTIETIFADTIIVRVRHKIKLLKRRIDAFAKSLTACPFLSCQFLQRSASAKTSSSAINANDDQTTFSGSDNVSELPGLQIDLVRPCDRSETLCINVNSFTGKLICEVPCLEEFELLEQLQNAMQNDSWDLIAPLLIKLKVALLLQRCRKTLVCYPVKVVSSIPLTLKSTILSSLATDRLYLKFRGFDGFYLIVEFKVGVDADVVLNYFILSGTWVTNLFPLNPHPFNIQDERNYASKTGGGCGEYIRPMSIVQLDVNALLYQTVKLPVLNALQPHFANKEIYKTEIQSFPCPAYFVAQLANAVAACVQRIPFLVLSDELLKRGVLFKPVSMDANGVGPSLRILSPGPLANCPAEIIEPFWRTVTSCCVRITGERTLAVSVFVVEFVFANPPLAPFTPDGSADAPPKPRKRNLVLNYPMLHELTAKNVDDLLSSIIAFAFLYGPALEFSKHYMAGMHRYIAVKAFTYHRLVLAYGPNFGYTVLFSRAQLDKPYHLSFGCLTQSASGGNPHSMMLQHFRKLYVETHDIANIMQMLHETTEPMLAISQLPRSTSQLLLPQDFPGSLLLQHAVAIPVSPSCVRLQYRNQFTFEVHFIRDRRICIKDVSPDCPSRAQQQQAGATSGKLHYRGLIALREFFERFGPTTTMVLRTEEVRVAVDIKMEEQDEEATFTDGFASGAPDAPGTSTTSASASIPPKLVNSLSNGPAASPGGFNLASPPPNLVPPSPLGQPASTSAAPATPSGGPMSVATPAPCAIPPSPATAAGGPPSVTALFNALPFTPSPAPASVLSNPMTPTPAPPSVSYALPPTTPGSVAPMIPPSPATPAVTLGFAQSPAPTPNAPPSPAANPMSQQGMSLASPAPIPSPLSLLTSLANAGGSCSSAAAAGDVSVTDANDVLTPFPERTPEWRMSTAPFVVEQSSFTAAFRRPPPLGPGKIRTRGTDPSSRQVRNLSPMDRFLGCIHLLARMESVSHTSESLSEVVIGSGVMTFKIGSVRCKIVLDPVTMTRLRLKVESLSSADVSRQVTVEDNNILEEYFINHVLGDVYKESNIVTFLKILQFGTTARHNLLRSFINIMKTQMNPEPNVSWFIELCLVVPPASSSLLTHPVAVGNPAIQVNKASKMLIWLKLVSPTDHSNQIALPLVYDMNAESNSITLLTTGSACQPHPHLQETSRQVENLLRRQSEYARHSGDCVVWLSVRDLQQNFAFVN